MADIGINGFGRIGRLVLRAALAKVGNDPVGNSQSEAERFVRAELAKWAKLVKDAGIKPQ